MALFPGLPGWAGTRKAKPIWILLKQETVSGSGISWAICKSAPRSRQITMPVPHHSSFLQAGCPSCHPANNVKALKASLATITVWNAVCACVDRELLMLRWLMWVPAVLSCMSRCVAVVWPLATITVWNAVCACWQRVTDATVADVSASCPMLSVLCMSKCDSITDEALAMLSHGCPQLTFVYFLLTIFGCLCWQILTINNYRY